MKNQSVHRIFVIGSVLMWIIFLTSCQPNNDSPSILSNLFSLPQEAKDAVIKKEQDACKKAGGECKDFKITWSYPLESTSADKANGVEEMWCVKVAYLSRSSGKWYDGSNNASTGGQIWLKAQGIWNISEMPFCERQK